MKKIAVWLAVLLPSLNPASAQTILNMSQDLVRLGIASSNMVPDQPAMDAGPLLVQAVKYAQAHQIDSVIADTGAYYFLSLQQQPNVHVSLNRLTNLTIDFQGSDLYLTHPLANGLVIGNSTNLVLENFTIDYQPLPFTQVQVVSVDPATRRLQFSIPRGWQDPSSLNAVYTGTQNGTGASGNVEVHVFRAGHKAPGVARMSAVLPISGNSITIAPDSFSTAAVLAKIRPGDIVALAMRTPSSPVLITTCTGCTIRNITAYSSAGDGVNLAYVQSTTMERVHTMPRPGTDRLISTFGQGFTPSGPNNNIRLSRAIRTLDDGFSFDLWVAGIVQSQTGSRVLTVAGTYATTISQGITIPNGTAVAFQRPSDGAVLGSASIVSQTAISNGQTPQVVFTFDRDLPSNLAGAAIYAIDANPRGGNTVMERNAVEEQTDCCTGMSIWGYANSTFRGNYIYRSGMTGVYVSHTLSPLTWQTPPAVNLTLTNNVIDEPNSTVTAYGSLQLGGVEILAQQSDFSPMAGSPNQNINITNNFIADSGSAAVWLGNTSNGSVSNNYFLNPNGNPLLRIPYGALAYLAGQALVVETSQNVSTGVNISDNTSGRAFVTDTQFRELAAYAPGSTVRLNAFNLGQLAAPSITLTDADGKITALAVRNTATHALDVQIPAAAGLGGAFLTVTAGGAKYFGTLFVDSVDNIPTLNGCTYEVSLSSASVAAAAANLPILVVTQVGCAYQVLAVDAFVNAGPVSTGSAVIFVGLGANAGAARTTTIEIAGQLFTLAQAAVPPVVPIVRAVFDSWDYTSGAAPGAWVTITGTSLAVGSPQTWNLSGVQQLPTMLGGVTVLFNGTAAALLYVSATQINALVPAGVAPGLVQVVVQSNGVSGSPFTIAATATLPAVYALPNADGSSFFVTAALQGTASLVGNSAVDSRVVRAAQAGDILDLYMIGLGATSDASKFFTNQVFSGAYPVSAPVAAAVGGEQAKVLFAGLTSPGLYLVRIVIPSDLPAGPQPIQISAGAAQTRSSLILMLGAGQ